MSKRLFILLFLLSSATITTTPMVAQCEPHDAGTPVQTLSSENDPKSVAEAVADNLVKIQVDTLYGLMDSTFHERVTKQDLAQQVEATHRMAGRMRRLTFQTVDRGQRFEPGRQMEIWKFWYVVGADNPPNGNQLLSIEVVSDRGKFACSTFSLVNFDERRSRESVGR